MKFKPILFSALTFLLLLSFTNDNEYWNSKNNLFLQGYDLVTYFKEGPVHGSEAFSVDYHGIQFYFASEENKQAFLKSPEKFLPKYGGWCAYALALEPKKVKVDPKTYKIIKGELYLFYNTIWGNTLKQWNKFEDEQQAIQDADTNWQKLMKHE